jgi:hypothetical protein
MERKARMEREKRNKETKNLPEVSLGDDMKVTGRVVRKYEVQGMDRKRALKEAKGQ